MPPVIAKESVIVHDDAIGIDREVIAGQPVPPDLVAAYTKATSDADAASAKPAAKSK